MEACQGAEEDNREKRGGKRMKGMYFAAGLAVICAGLAGWAALGRAQSKLPPTEEQPKDPNPAAPAKDPTPAVTPVPQGSPTPPVTPAPAAPGPEPTPNQAAPKPPAFPPAQLPEKPTP